MTSRNPQYVNSRIDDRADYLHFPDVSLHHVKNYRAHAHENRTPVEHTEQQQSSCDDTDPLTCPKEITQQHQSSRDGISAVTLQKKITKEPQTSCDDTSSLTCQKEIDKEHQTPAEHLYEEIADLLVIPSDPTHFRGQSEFGNCDPETDSSGNKGPGQSVDIELQHPAADNIKKNENNRRDKRYRCCRQRQMLKYVGTLMGCAALFAAVLFTLWYMDVINSAPEQRMKTFPIQGTTQNKLSEATTHIPVTTEVYEGTKPDNTILSAMDLHEVAEATFSAYKPLERGPAQQRTKVHFNSTWTSNKRIIDQATYTIPSQQVYLVSLSADYYNNVNYSLFGSDNDIGLSSSSSGEWSSAGRTVLMDIAGGTSLHIQYTGEIQCCRGTTWSMFTVSGAMDPLVAFTATRTTEWTQSGQITFQHTLINTGEGYKHGREFVAPITGIYFFSQSAAVPAHQTGNLQMRINGQKVIEILHTDTTHSRPAMISSAVLVSLTQDDTVHVELVSGSLHSSREYNEVSWSGFLYQPRYGDSYAWSVWKSTSWTGIEHLEPVPYDVVLVNEGSLYNTSHHFVSIPVSGVYYVHLVGGFLYGYAMDMFINVGRSLGEGEGTAYIYHDGSDASGVHTISLGVILALNAGERVWVSAFSYKEDSALYSTKDLVTGFSGFLIYAT